MQGWSQAHFECTEEFFGEIDEPGKHLASRILCDIRCKKRAVTVGEFEEVVSAAFATARRGSVASQAVKCGWSPEFWTSSAALDAFRRVSPGDLNSLEDELLGTLVETMVSSSDLDLDRLHEKVADMVTKAKPSMSESEITLVIVAVLLVIAVLAYQFFWRDNRQNNTSEEFRSVAGEYGDKVWAQQLLEVGDPQTWSLLDAWREVSRGYDENTRETAIHRLAELEECKLVEPEAGDQYTHLLMTSSFGPEEYVSECRRAGLTWKGQTPDNMKAEVVTATSDYIALMASEPDVKESLISLHEYEREESLDEYFEFDPVLLDILEIDFTGKHEKLEKWLGTVAEQAPSMDLKRAIGEETGQRFAERRMYSTTKMINKAQAEVKSISHRGLIRVRDDRPDDVLLQARVSATNTGDGGDPYDQL